jgi:hypothetical protein
MKLIFSVLVTVGIYRLGKRKSSDRNWKWGLLSNKIIRNVLPIIFIGGNLLVLIFGAKPRDPGKIPRFWWPVSFFIIMAVSFLYWCSMIALSEKPNSQEQTLGKTIGLQIIIYNESEADITMPTEMLGPIEQSRLDGSRRRVDYKVSQSINIQTSLNLI